MEPGPSLDESRVFEPVQVPQSRSATCDATPSSSGLCCRFVGNFPNISPLIDALLSLSMTQKLENGLVANIYQKRLEEQPSTMAMVKKALCSVDEFNRAKSLRAPAPHREAPPGGGSDDA